MAYIGENSAADMLGGEPRYFYALRRTDGGDLYFCRVDQALGQDSVTINNPAAVGDDFTDFSSGADFFEGRDVYHNIVYPNLNYEQMRWDERDLYYYIDDDGNQVNTTKGWYAVCEFNKKEKGHYYKFRKYRC